MARKIYSINVSEEHIKLLDSFIINPVSRSDIIDDLIGYCLQETSIIQHFVEKNLEAMRVKTESS